MQITFSLSPTILLIIVFLIHTIITHLMNWWYRELDYQDEDFTIAWIILFILEIGVTITLITKLS